MKLTLPTYFLLAIAGTAKAQVDCSQYQKTVILDQDTNGLLQLSYVVNITDSTSGQGTLSAELVYEGLGWIALGFSETGSMFPAQAVIGLPDDSTSVGKYDLSSTDISGVLPSSTKTLENTYLAQNDTHTIMRFSKLLTESGEISIDGNGNNIFIWAYGTDNTLAYHAQRGSYSVQLSACSTGDSSSSSPVAIAPSTSAPSAAPTPAPTQAAQAPTPPSGSSLDCSGFQQQVQLSDGLTLSYTVTLDANDASNGFLSVQLVYAGQAWLGLGVSTSQSGAMVPSDSVIGLPDDGNSQSNPGKYTLTSRDISGVVLLDSSRQTLMNSTIEQNDTHTVLTYDKILIEANEVSIVLNSNMAFIWAVGYSNPLSVHKSRGAVSLTLSACVPGESVSSTGGATVISTPSNYQSYYSAHGILAGIAWGILSPIAIGASLLRDLIPKAGLWFKIHMFLNMTVFLFTVIAFTVAVVATEKGTVSGASANHFSGLNHRTVGLIIMICICLQVLGGMLRPHAPGKKENGEPEEKPLIRLMWELIHKASGYGLLATAWWQVQNGIQLYATRYATKDLTAVFWGIAAGIAGVIALLYFYSKCVVRGTKNKEVELLDETDTRV